MSTWKLGFRIWLKHHGKISKLTEKFENSRGAAERVSIWYSHPSLSHVYGEIWPHMFLAQNGPTDRCSNVLQAARVGLGSSRSKEINKSFHSLFFEKCKVKKEPSLLKKSFHSFPGSEMWNQSASRPRWRSESSQEFFNDSREARFFNKIILWNPKNPDKDDLL